MVYCCIGILVYKNRLFDYHPDYYIVIPIKQYTFIHSESKNLPKIKFRQGLLHFEEYYPNCSILYLIASVCINHSINKEIGSNSQLNSLKR